MNSYVPYGDLKGGRLMLAAFVLALANFMVVLDMTIANVSVPHITGSLAVSSSQGTWVITSYAVAEAICVPLTGWLAGRFGGVRVFTLSLIGFTIFSVLCGLSTSLEMLVIWWPDHATQSDVTDADFPSRKAIPSDGHVGNDDGGWPDSWSDFRGNHQ